MTVDPQTFIRLVEAAGTVCFLDSEFSNLKADFGSLICISIKPLTGKTKTFSVEKLGNDKAVIKAAFKELEKYDLVVTFYGQRADIPYLRSRALRWKIQDIPKIYHCDIYWPIRTS